MLAFKFPAHIGVLAAKLNLPFMRNPLISNSVRVRISKTFFKAARETGKAHIVSSDAARPGWLCTVLALGEGFLYEMTGA